MLFPKTESKKDSKPTLFLASTFTTSLSLAHNNEVYNVIKKLIENNEWNWIINLHPKMDAEIVQKFKQLEQYYNFKHTPHPFRKSTFEECFKNNKEVFLNNIQYKFRNNEQFLVQSLINHIEIENKTCVLKDNLQLIYFRTFKKPLIWYKIKLNLQSDKKLFLALQSLYLASKPTLDYFLNWLDKRVK